VGIVVHRKVGDFVRAGEPVMTIHAEDEQTLAETLPRLKEALAWQKAPVEPLPLFYGVVA
jgi:pyrimidine-nucleoside phosphorylase